MSVMRVCVRCNGILHGAGEACPKLVPWGKRDTARERQRKANVGVLAKIKRGLLASRPFCNKCGCRGVRLELDHIVPVYKGGLDVPANLQLLCVPCHSAKTNFEKNAGKSTFPRSPI